MSTSSESFPSVAKLANPAPGSHDVTVGVIINITININPEPKQGQQIMGRSGDPNVPPPSTIVNILVNSRPGDPNVPPPS